MSRPSLRKAIQKLVAKGLLTTRHGCGTQVTDRLEAHFIDPLQDLPPRVASSGALDNLPVHVIRGQ